MALKYSITTRVGGTDINGNAATADFTSDAILIKEDLQVTINFFFAGLTFTGNDNPTLTIEESNSTDLDSFIPIDGWTDVDLPEFFKDFKAEAEYIRLVYSSNSATAGTIEVQTRFIKP